MNSFFLKICRSQVRLNKLGDQLGLDTYVTDANEEDASINIVSDGETDFPAPLHKKRMIDVSPIKKRIDLNRDPAQEPKAGKLFNKTICISLVAFTE